MSAKSGSARKKEAHDPHDEITSVAGWDGRILGRLAGYAREHAGLFALSFLVLALLFALNVIEPWIWRNALDGPVAGAVAERDAAAVEGRAAVLAPYLTGFWWHVAAYAAVVLIASWLRYQEVAQLNRAGQAVIADLRTRLFRHIQSLDLSFFDRRPTGSLVTRVSSDIENLNEMFTSGLVVLLADLLKVAALLVLLFWLEWRLALVVLAGTPVLIGISLIFRGGARDAHRTVRARLARLNGYLQEVLQGMRVVQLFRRERLVSERFAGHLASYLQANLRTIFLFALFFPAIDFAVTGIQAGALWRGGISIVGGTMTYGEFVQFWFYVAMLVAPIRELGERYNVLQSAFASAERIFQILDTQTRVKDGARALDPAAVRGHVRFEDVTFRYEGGSEAVRHVSFEIRPGETVAVVGATGAGKSTLVNLLLRYYDPSGGRITLDGVDLRELELERLRSLFGLVLQEDFLFAGSVRENLVMERAEVDEDALEIALDASRASELVARLPGGLSAPVAERGATFSTGERQLLAIARALAGRPRIVILDEATASVDSHTESRIEAATNRLLEGRSALVIAHRLSTVRNADRILVVHRGELRESGTHDELLARGGIYARLHQLQFAEAGAEA